MAIMYRIKEVNNGVRAEFVAQYRTFLFWKPVVTMTIGFDGETEEVAQYRDSYVEALADINMHRNKRAMRKPKIKYWQVK